MFRQEEFFPRAGRHREGHAEDEQGREALCRAWRDRRRVP